MRAARKRRLGMSHFELLIVLCTISVLLCIGFFGYRRFRQQARVTLAESRLRQLATGFELYFRKHTAYPPQGCDISEALGEHVGNPTVFENPLAAEGTAGETLSLLYSQPTVAQLDEPNNYLTAFASQDGTAVVLLTGGRVVRLTRLDYDTGNYGTVLASLLASTDDGTDDKGRPGGIKYICVKGGGGVTYQGTYKRLGNSQKPNKGGPAGKDVYDTFSLALSKPDGSHLGEGELNETVVKLDIHAANKIVYDLPSGTTFADLTGDGDGDGKPGVALLDPDTGEPSGWTVRLDRRTSGGAQITVDVDMDIHASEDMFHALTRVWVEFAGLTVEPTDTYGNKFYATRTEGGF